MARGVRKPYVHVDRRKTGNTHGKIVPRVVVLHSTESHDRPGTSDVSGVLRYLERTPDELGIHFVVDKEGLVGQGANRRDKVYHAKGANGFSIGIEQIGFAHETPWNRIDRKKQLDKVARLLAWLSKVEGIPLRHSTSRGVALHRDFPGGGHSDPGGPGEYPLGWVLRRARWYKLRGWILG